MKKLPLIMTTFAVALGLTTLTATAATDAAKPESTKMAEKTVVDKLVKAEQFKTLVAAVTAAGLVETLQGDGPFTIFAPNDAAFAKLPEGTVEDLLKPENKEKLVAILTYHVVPAKVMAADVKTMKAPTVEGTEASVVVADGSVKIDDATVIATDMEAGNGVIHEIDTVIMP